MMMASNKQFTNRVTQSVLEIRSPNFYARPSQARAVRKRSGFVFPSTDRVTRLVNRQAKPLKKNFITLVFAIIHPPLPAISRIFIGLESSETDLSRQSRQLNRILIQILIDFKHKSSSTPANPMASSRGPDGVL